MRTPLFTGSCPALITPFNQQGEIDYEAFARQIEHQIAQGAAALCVCGTTGEAATLSPAERESLISFCVKQSDERVKVIAGTGGNNTATVIENTMCAQVGGADAALIVTPYYNKTTQQGLLKHYEAIAARTDLPIILYNVPGRTGLSFAAETYLELSKNPQFNGVKEASGSLELMVRTRNLCGDDFFIWSGNDDQVVPMMALGAKGVISVAGNIIPEVMAEMCRFCLANDVAQAAELQLQYAELIDALFCEVNPIPVKYAMKLMGVDAGVLRLPLCEVSPVGGERVQQALKKLKLVA